MADVSLVSVFFVWVVGFGLLSVLLRGRVSRLLLWSRLPRIVNYYILLTPLVLIEESLTCESPYFSCITLTLPAFYFLFLLLYLMQSRLRMGHVKTAMIFGVIGWFDEFILVGRLFHLPFVIVLIVTPLTIAIYAVLAILPSYYLEQEIKRRA